MTTTTPGFVQNCPAPIVSDAAHPAPISAPRAEAAAGSTKTGLIDPSSPKNGMGSGRCAHRSNSARPPRSDPVKPTALISGCCTSACPTSSPPPWINENTPAGMSQAVMAAAIAAATTSAVPGCAWCPLTTTGQPAAKADAVSPPAVEKASGKFDAPKTATGPIGRWIIRKSDRGKGVRSGRAASWRASRKSPSRICVANIRS